MDREEFFEWLEKEGLMVLVKKNLESFMDILSHNFDPYKKLVILSDFGFPSARIAPVLAGIYAFCAEKLHLNYRLIVQQPRALGEDADDRIIEAFLKADSDHLLCLSFSDRIGSLKSIGKSFRKYTFRNKISFLSTMGLSQLKTSQFDSFMCSINVDYWGMHQRGGLIKKALDEGKMVRITTPAGTDLTMDISGYKAIPNDGDYHGKRGGNLPVGEMYIAPVKRTAEGVLVIDVSSRNREGTVLTNEDKIFLTIKEGEIKSIKGGEAARMLEESFDWAIGRAKHSWGIKLVCELGIGINPNAEILGPTIVNEKKVGTAHIAFGSNSWFGGDIFALTHFDQVIDNPTIEIDGKPLDLNNILDYDTSFIEIQKEFNNS